MHVLEASPGLRAAKRNREILMACQNDLLYTCDYLILKLHCNVMCSLFFLTSLYLYLCGFKNRIYCNVKFQYIMEQCAFLVCHVLVVLGTIYDWCFIQVGARKRSFCDDPNIKDYFSSINCFWGVTKNVTRKSRCVTFVQFIVFVVSPRMSWETEKLFFWATLKCKFFYIKCIAATINFGDEKLKVLMVRQIDFS
jgi:hypothetical protein